MLRIEQERQIDKLVEKIKSYLDDTGLDAWIGELREMHKSMKKSTREEQAHYEKRGTRPEHDCDVSSSSNSEEEEESEEEEPEKKIRLEDPEFVSKLTMLDSDQRQIVRAILSQFKRVMKYDYSATNKCGRVQMDVEFGGVCIVFFEHRILVSGYADQYMPPPSGIYEQPPPFFCLSENAYLYTTENIDRVVKQINSYFKEIQDQARFIQRERERYTTLIDDLTELKQELAKIKIKIHEYH